MASKLSLFLAELKQRKVVGALVAYGAVVLAILQGADLLFAILLLPDIAFTLLAIGCMAGFPVVVVLSWVYDLTVYGLRRASEVTEEVKHQRVPLKRYLELVGAFTVAGLVIAVTAGAVGRANYPTSSEDGTVGLAVFPFRTLGGIGAEWSEGAPDLLATSLDGTPGLRVVDPWPLWANLRDGADSPAPAPEPDEATVLTGEAQAHRYLLGSVVPSGDQVEVALRLYQIGRSEPIGVFSIQSDASDLSNAVRELALLTLTHVWGPLRPRDLPGELGIDATQSPEAMKAYLAAKEAMRRGLFDSANVAIDRAIVLDSTFALAMVEAVAIKSWLVSSQGGSYGGFFELLDRAEPHAEALNERTRLRLRAARASVRTDGAAAIDAAQRILRIDPLDYLANASLEYYDRVLGWQLGPPQPGRRAAAEGVFLMDSIQVPALLVRTWWAVSLGDTADQRVQLQRLRHLAGERSVARHQIRALETLLASEEGFQEVLRSPPGTLPGLVAMASYLRTGNPSRYERLLESVRGSGDPNLARVAAREAVRLAVARGHLASVDAGLRDGSLAGANLDGLAQQFLVAADLAGVGEREMARRAVEAVVSRLPPDSALAFFNTHPVWLEGWLVGAWSAQYGDTLLAQRWIDAIGTLPPGGTSEDYRGSLQADIAGRLATRRGDPGEALDRAGSAFALWTIHTENEYEYAAEPVMRFELALRYRDSGMADSARAVFSSLLPPTTWMGFLTARASFELGEMAAAQGRGQDAIAYYRRAVQMWEGGGPSVASFRERALVELDRLLLGGDQGKNVPKG
ncbi:MAG: hypothetical protein PVJ76_10330 [Gemmatimonadota bacterium]